jgi:hypothetical protein
MYIRTMVSAAHVGSQSGPPCFTWRFRRVLFYVQYPHFDSPSHTK